MMDFEASNKLKFCDFDDDGNFRVKCLASCEKSKPDSDLKELVTCEEFEFKNDNDNVPFTPRLSPISSFATCNCKHDAPVKMRDTTIIPVKRVFDNNNSLDISVKKSKVALAPDDDADDDISLSSVESAKSYKKCKRKRRFEEKRLKSINREIEECLKELGNKKTQISCVRRIREIAERKEEELKALSQKIAECTMELEATKKELLSEKKKLLWVISTRQKRNDCAHMENFESMKKKFEGQVKELESKLKQCEGQVEELEQNEKHYKEWVKALESRDKQLEGRMMEFELMEEELESRKKELESKEKLVEGRMMEFELMEEELESRKKKLESKEKLVERRKMKLKSKENQHESREEKIETKEKRIEDQEKELEFKKQDFERQLEELQSKENQFIGRVKEFESEKDKFEVNQSALGAELVFKQKQICRRTRVVESKEKQLEGQVKEYQSKEREFEKQKKELEFKKENLESHIKELESKENKFKVKVKELDSKENKFKVKVKELNSKEKQHEGQVKEHQSKEREFEDRVKELESKENKFKVKVKELDSKEKQHEGRVKEHQSKERQFEDRVKELESNENKFKVKVKELDSKEKQHEGHVKEHQSKERQFEDQVKELESKENKFKVKVKELDLKEKPFEGEVKELESKLNKFDAQLKEPELRWIQYEALMNYINEEKDLDTSEETDVVESLCNDILVYLLESSDPSREVLDMIQNPIIPLCKKGDNGGIIVGYHIYLLEQLMRISPNIEPCVREEALKLALDLKAYMKENTENSLTVLAFLLLLPIYGLLTSFNEDEVMELFAFVAQHKIAIELFGTLGFANKVSDIVENLIKRKQFVGAVRFSCAYNLAGKNQLVDMLREHIQNAKLICESSCEKTNSLEIKDEARDEEIASLRTVLQCISDNKILESEDLLKKEIRRRILELKAQKGN